MFGPDFGIIIVLCVPSSFTTLSLKKRELVSLRFVFLFVCMYVLKSFPKGAINWSVLCEFGISCSYSLVLDLNHFCVSLAIYYAVLFNCI